MSNKGLFDNWNKPGEGKVPEGPMLFFLLLIVSVLLGAIYGILKALYSFLIWIF